MMMAASEEEIRFKKYVSGYDLEDLQIRLKVIHTLSLIHI